MESTCESKANGSPLACVLRVADPRDLLSAEAAKKIEMSQDRLIRRRDGIFFSSSSLADYVSNRVKGLLQAGASVADPTCGAGELLLSCLQHCKREENSLSTATGFSKLIHGYDLQPEFAEATKLRLAAYVADAHRDEGIQDATSLSSLFVNIHHRDYLEFASGLGCVDIIVTNPPFGTAIASPGCSWSSGKTQRAAVFIDLLLAHAKVGQHIVAILPDVLRSGSRYLRWRQFVESKCQVIDIHPYGSFGESADVDVFVLHAVKRDPSVCSSSDGDWSEHSKNRNRPKIADDFDVSIGPVVPHRHANVGPWCFYINVSEATPDAEVTRLGKRRFKGRLFEPPFVVVRRTSSPSDSRRIIPTLVQVDGPVAVENHLMVISPHDRSIVSCRRIMSSMVHDRVNSWVNTVNRCRHLTKGLVENIPLGD